MATGPISKRGVLCREASQTAGPVRSAVTLLELILVLAIIGVTTALALPTLQSLYVDEGLSQGGDQVRGAWSSARSHAINDGVAFRFGVVMNTGRWRIAPDSDTYWSGGGGDAQAFTDENKMPLNISFRSKAGGGSAGGSADTGEVDASAYARLVTFYPDGTIQCYLPDGSAVEDQLNVTLSTEDGGRSLQLTLRPLTGSVTSRWIYPDGSTR